MIKLYKVWQKYYMVFLRGLGGTLWISAVTLVFGTILGLFVAVLRMIRVKPLNALASAYVEVLRGTPVLLQLYFFWIGLPKLFPMLGMTDTQSVICALIINSSAYISEIIRAGIGAVDQGQWEAARSVGLSEKNVFFRVILPQAVKNILPAMASTFFVPELITSYKTVQSATFLAIQSLTIAGIIYFFLDLLLSWLLRLLERRLRESD